MKLINVFSHYRGLFHKIGWWLVLLLLILGAATFTSHYRELNKLLEGAWHSIFMLLIGMFIGIVLWCALKNKNSYKSYKLSFSGAIDFIKSEPKRIFNYSLPAFLLMIVITLIVIVIVALINKHLNVGLFNWLVNFLTESPGGLFGIILGTATLVGTLIAIQSILEIKRIITNYPQLLDRITALIDEIKDPSEEVKIMCYFPLPGNWQVSSPNIKYRFEESLKHKERKISIKCLTEEQHLMYILTIAKRMNELRRNTISGIKLLDFQLDTEFILKKLNGEEIYANHKDRKTHRKGKEYCSKPIREDFDKILPYYFFVSDHRAIIVTPVGLPKIDHEIISPQELQNLIEKVNNHTTVTPDREEEDKSYLGQLIEKYINPKETDSYENIVHREDARVDTLGFETTDRLIIQKLHNIFK